MATTFTDFKDVKDTETPKSSEESKDFKEEGGTGNTTPGTESKSPQGGRVGSDVDFFVAAAAKYNEVYQFTKVIGRLRETFGRPKEAIG